ncbi:MAG TPA: FAD-dependent oxidoreductase [Terriglobia bacterium]|nr:FAD-dependent oxidoreductase [Terriglobia bacterium]
MPIDRRSFVGQLAFALGGLVRGKSAAASGFPAASAGAGIAASKPGAEGSIRGRLGGYILPDTIELIHKKFDLVVVGGGISGTCAAISAARNGARVALVHERSTLGGNSSSEVRLYPEDTCGHNPWIKEAGILEEMTVEDRVRNWEPYTEGLMNSHWDLVLYEWARREKNLALFLNTTMREVEMADSAHILAIHADQLGTEKEFIFEAPMFVDATGDGVLIYRSGADFRWGKEARSEYNEPLAPEKPSDAVMGSTLFFRARDAGKPVKFKKPDWAAEFDTEADLTHRNHGFIEGGYWWIEVGFPLHPIKDNEAIRDQALRQLLGVWDHIKNRCTDDSVRKRAENYALEFVGFWPYKRESRRMLGDYVLREEDVRNPSVHSDDIAYGTWGIDIHVPGGILERHVPPYPSPSSDANFAQRGTIPYGIPLRSCYSRKVRNLLAAGRPISASYVAFASSRVLPTGAIVGQGVGAAAALCVKHQCEPREIAKAHAKELQQMLLRQDASMPGIENEDPHDLARQARVKASSEGVLKFPESSTFHPAHLPLAQLFPIATDHLDGVELFLRSELSTPVEIKLGLKKAEHVWDFRSGGDIAVATAKVPPNHQGYVRFSFDAKTEAGKLHYIHMGAQEGISWALFSDVEGEPSQIPVGTTAADMPAGGRWRPMTHAKSFCLRLAPEQRSYGPQNVVRGSNRPDLWTNLYMSDPEQPLPSWLELQLPRSTDFNQIQITFDTDCNRRIRLPLFRYPECVKRYEIAVGTAAGWRTIVRQDDNYFRRRVHNFDLVRSNRVRINFYETNGAKAVRVYEVRIYNEK